MLSLLWALESCGDFSRPDAVEAAARLLGIPPSRWEACMQDTSWFIGDPRWNTRQQIEEAWNQRFATVTRGWLTEDEWHLPLWQAWLRSKKMVFGANLTYLLRQRGYGSVKRLASHLGRNKATASKWGRWQQEGEKVRVPPSTDMPLILEFFGLSPRCDLYTEPLFLGRTEIEEVLLKAEGKHYLDGLTGEFLRQGVARLRDEWASQAYLRRPDR